MNVPVLLSQEEESQSLAHALDLVSRKMSKHNCKFISAFSVMDLKIFLTEKYADLLEQTKKKDNEQNTHILEKTTTGMSLKKAEDILKDINEIVEKNNAAKAKILSPYTKLSYKIERKIFVSNLS